MRDPPGVSHHTSAGEPRICELRRSLYGLRQAGREWAKLLSNFILKWSFTRSAIDVCLFIYNSRSSILWLLVYVDDILICDNCAKLRARFVDALSQRFPVEDKGELKWILNTAITRERGARNLTMLQSLYISDMLQRFDSYLAAANSRNFDSPMDDSFVLSPKDSPAINSPEWVEMSPQRDNYMAVVERLLRLANMTRFDLCYAASQLARFMTNPGPTHFSVAIYLRSTVYRKLTFRPNEAMGFETFVDSN